MTTPDEIQLRRRIAAHLRGDRWTVEKTAAECGVSQDRVREIAVEEGVDIAPVVPVPGLRRGKARKDIDG